MTSTYTGETDPRPSSTSPVAIPASSRWAGWDGSPWASSTACSECSP